MDVDPDRGIGYVALRLAGMREYRADISLTPVPHEGTDIRWRATFTSTIPLLNRVWEWYFDRAMRDVVAASAHYAERR